MPKRAVLLVNLGSPESTSVPDVRRYLRETGKCQIGASPDPVVVTPKTVAFELSIAGFDRLAVVLAPLGLP